MKTKDVVSKEFQKTIKCGSFLSSPETGYAAKIGKKIKKIIFIGGLAGTGLFLNSCMAGYVATEPAYVEYSRPARTSDLDIWIDGDWVFNQSSHMYVQNNGYWHRPQQNRVYMKGSWQSTPRGKHWEKGRWEKKEHQRNRHSRDD